MNSPDLFSRISSEIPVFTDHFRPFAIVDGQICLEKGPPSKHADAQYALGMWMIQNVLATPLDEDRLFMGPSRHRDEYLEPKIVSDELTQEIVDGWPLILADILLMAELRHEERKTPPGYFGSHEFDPVIAGFAHDHGIEIVPPDSKNWRLQCQSPQSSLAYKAFGEVVRDFQVKRKGCFHQGYQLAEGWSMFEYLGCTSEEFGVAICNDWPDTLERIYNRYNELLESGETDWLGLAHQLDLLNPSGPGKSRISLIASIASAIRSGDFDYARGMCYETDKIPPDFVPFLKTLFQGMDKHPWTALDQLRNQPSVSTDY